MGGRSTSGRDNYDGFLHRLRAAEQDLSAVHATLEQANAVLSVLCEDAEDSLRQWRDRLDLTARMLDAYEGAAEGYRRIAELHDLAREMTATLTRRTETLRRRSAAAHTRLADTEAVLSDLRGSERHLLASRSDTEDREALLRAIRDTASSADTDPAARTEVTEARRAIASAEALVELKGH